jgi:hypothetical protein
MSTWRCGGVGLTAVASQPAAAMWVMLASSPVPPPVNTSPHPAQLPVSGRRVWARRPSCKASTCSPIGVPLSSMRMLVPPGRAAVTVSLTPSSRIVEVPGCSGVGVSRYRGFLPPGRSWTVGSLVCTR